MGSRDYEEMLFQTVRQTYTHTHTQSFDLVYAKSFIRQYRLSKTLNVRTLLLSLVSITYGIKTVINMALLLVFPIVT